MPPHTGQFDAAEPAQMLSQVLSQQNASSAQMTASQVLSSQPVEPFAVQQSPSPGGGAQAPQSVSQLLQSSPPLQAPSPQELPQSSGQFAVVSLSVQVPSPQDSPPPQTAQKSAASPAQMLSQLLAQQNPSMSQTIASQPASPQPVVPLSDAEQQSFGG